MVIHREIHIRANHKTGEFLAHRPRYFGLHFTAFVPIVGPEDSRTLMQKVHGRTVPGRQAKHSMFDWIEGELVS